LPLGGLLSVMTNQTTLVIGGTGKTGRRVAERLKARGVAVRAASRSSEIPFDWHEPATWEPALRGASAAYISYYPDLAAPGAADAIGGLSALAVRTGVRRLVLLSGRGEDEAQRAERALQDSGADWTIVRCSWFAQNFSEGAFAESIAAGELALPVDSIGEPFVDVEDIADVAAAALTEDGHTGELYELTGPRLLTFAGAVGAIAAASGREVRFVRIGLDEFTREMAALGVPEDEVALLRFLFTEVLDGRNAYVTDGVRRALGREPTDFSNYARRAWGRS
jgi:uncharacterized protein YbjT (DUF2867 family)